MIAERIRELLHAVPFQGFFIELDDGKRIGVEDPTYLALAPSGRTMVVQNCEETMQFIDVGQIIRVVAA